MKRKTRIVMIVAGAALLLTGLTACGSNFKGAEFMQDADVASRNTAPADIINMPDGFPNVSTKCDHGNRVYVTRQADGNSSTGRDIAVVPNDPTCAK